MRVSSSVNAEEFGGRSNVCYDFQKGNCSRSACRFAHDSSASVDNSAGPFRGQFKDKFAGRGGRGGAARGGASNTGAPRKSFEKKVSSTPETLDAELSAYMA